MTWCKLDDGFWSDPDVEAVGNEAAGAFVRMVSYCGQHLTDGHVPGGVARYITRAPILRRLEDATFLTPNGDGWLIPSYLDFNPSRADVESRRQRRSEAGRRGGVASGKARSK